MVPAVGRLEERMKGEEKREKRREKVKRKEERKGRVESTSGGSASPPWRPLPAWRD